MAKIARFMRLFYVNSLQKCLSIDAEDVFELLIFLCFFVHLEDNELLHAASAILISVTSFSFLHRIHFFVRFFLLQYVLI